MRLKPFISLYGIVAAISLLKFSIFCLATEHAQSFSTFEQDASVEFSQDAQSYVLISFAKVAVAKIKAAKKN